MIKISNIDIPRPGNSADKDTYFLARNLSLNISKGEGFGIIGPNGSGKSTLIKSIIGLSRYSSGQIDIEPNIKIGYMPQNYRSGVLSWLTIENHFSMSLTSSGKAVAMSFLADIGFQPEPNRRLANLSGGELQLTFMATLIGQNCRLLLLDEPLSAIDFVRRGKTIERLNRELAENSRSILMISHHLEDTRAMCDNFIVLSGNEDVPHKQFSSKEEIDLMSVF